MSSGEVCISRGGSNRKLPRHEITRADEVSWGLYLRTSKRNQWALIPAKIYDFDSLKREIREMGIPVVKASVPPNWEELAGVLVFIGTMFCAIFAHSASILTANLLISLLVAVLGFLIVSANPDNLPKMRWARFGIFLPVLMTASMLWVALKG